MFLEPRALLMLAVLVGVTGWVLKGLLVTWHRLKKENDPRASRLDDMEERLRKIEAATSSLLVDVSGMREKQRFMTKLQAGASEQRSLAAVADPAGEGISPMSTQSIPIISRVRKL